MLFARILVEDEEGDAAPEKANALSAAAASLSLLSTCMMESVVVVLITGRLAVVDSDEVVAVVDLRFLPLLTLPVLRAATSS